MNQPWLNLENYTIAELSCFLIGVVFWIYAYFQVIIDNHKNKTLGLPIAAVCLNFGWEVGAVLFFKEHIDMGKIFVIGYSIWLIMDIIIVYQMFKYGKSQIDSEYIKKRLNYILIVGLMGSITAHSFFFIEGFELPMGVIAGYIINAIMSVAYCSLVFNKNFNGVSIPIAWAKGLGTAIISICFFMKYPDKNFLTTMYIMTFIFDAAYLYLLYNIRPRLMSGEI